MNGERAMRKLIICSVVAALLAMAPQPGHTQSGDSTCTITSCDLNGDSGVTLNDLMEIIKVIRDSSSALPLWRFDLNADCVIDSSDIETFLFYTFTFPIVPYLPKETCCNPEVAISCCYVYPGNIDGDPYDRLNIVDITYLVNYLFFGGPDPLCKKEANVDGDSKGTINVVDLTKAASWLFAGGYLPNCYGASFWPTP
jgi:hypothetical protein